MFLYHNNNRHKKTSRIEHGNKKYEEDNIINTIELQKRLREEILGKIYIQSNNWVFKWFFVCFYMVYLYL